MTRSTYARRGQRLGISCGYKLRDGGRVEHESRQRRTVMAQRGMIYVIYVSLIDVLLLLGM